MKSVTPPDHPMFQMLQRFSLQRGLLQKIAEIAPTIKDKIQAVTEESQRADHVVIEICMTHTANETSPTIYIGGWTRRKGKKKKKKGKAKTSLPLERRDLSKLLFHCTQRLNRVLALLNSL